MKRILALPSFLPSVLAAIGLLGLAQPAAAADAAKEMNQAALHAGMAAGASDVKTAHSHMHHVINCLVGPKGADFDKAEQNPCKGEGNGAIEDAPKDKRASLEHALSTSKSALEQSDLAKVKELASAVKDEIKKAE